MVSPPFSECTLLTDSLADDFCHIVDLLIGHSRVKSYPEGIFHDAVCIFQASCNAVAFACCTHLVKTWMFSKVSCKKHSGLYTFAFDIWNYFITVNAIFTGKKKTLTKTVAAALLKEGRVSMSGLYSEKTGRTYDAVVVLDDTGGKYVNFKLEFPARKGGRK